MSEEVVSMDKYQDKTRRQEDTEFRVINDKVKTK
ncbi:hypothetical protein ES708_09053 [subsurface metagenome]